MVLQLMELIDVVVVVVVVAVVARTAAGRVAEDQTDGEWQEESQELDIVLGRPHRSLPFHLQRIHVSLNRHQTLKIVCYSQSD